MLKKLIEIGKFKINNWSSLKKKSYHNELFNSILQAQSYLTLSNEWSDLVTSFGLTQDPLNKNYFLVMYLMNTDLRKYLQ